MKVYHGRVEICRVKLSEVEPWYSYVESSIMK